MDKEKLEKLFEIVEYNIKMGEYYLLPYSERMKINPPTKPEGYDNFEL